MSVSSRSQGTGQADLLGLAAAVRRELDRTVVGEVGVRQRRELEHAAALRLRLLHDELDAGEPGQGHGGARPLDAGPGGQRLDGEGMEIRVDLEPAHGVRCAAAPALDLRRLGAVEQERRGVEEHPARRRPSGRRRCNSGRR